LTTNKHLSTARDILGQRLNARDLNLNIFSTMWYRVYWNKKEPIINSLLFTACK